MADHIMSRPLDLGAYDNWDATFGGKVAKATEPPKLTYDELANVVKTAAAVLNTNGWGHDVHQKAMLVLEAAKKLERP